MKKLIPVVFLLLIGISCTRTEDDILAIEHTVLPTFYIEGQEPEPSSLSERMAHHGVTGLSVAVFMNGDLAWAKGYGLADLDLGKKVTEETLFQAASISKPVAATAVHRLAETGKLDLDTNINEYLTSWKLTDNEFTVDEKVTFARLMNHTAGTTVWGFPGYSRTEVIPSTVDVVSGKGNTDSVFVYKEPGASWRYSGGGYTVMQIALGDVTAQSFEELMSELVLEPAGMNESTFEQPLPDSLHDRAATGYTRDSTAVGDGSWHVYPEQAAAGLWTTPTDLGKFAVSIQRSYNGEKGALLSKETAERMLTPGQNDFGLGPSIRYNNTHFGHGGSNAGFRGDLIASLDGDYAVAIMTNSDNGSAVVSELQQAIFRHYGWSGPEPLVKAIDPKPVEYLYRFEGQYLLPDVGQLSMGVTDSSLVLLGGGIQDQKVILAPENDSTFFSVDNGNTFHFDIQDGKVLGFRYRDYHFSKIETESN